ncbi:MAG: anhydro-N-acetylmuramic acid kinase [Phycisphaerales bacterium]|nr:anhydro-N-acetylmuramic acid kinase [Phycisphaerales bacterium]
MSDGTPKSGSGDAVRRRLVVGCMTGTSIDGLDVAMVEVRGTGLELSASVVGTSSVDLGAVRDRLRALADGAAMTAGEIAEVTLEFSRLHADAIGALLNGRRADLVCVHGQTVFHRPPLSWQLLNPWPIARTLRAPVVFDLRGADVASGGQGAPITPIADAVLLGSCASLAAGFAVVNLGGFANFTAMPAAGGRAISARLSEIRGGDLCVCNQLLDRLARLRFGLAYDHDGERASRGVVSARESERLGKLLRAAQSKGTRSLGSGDECFGWVEESRSMSGEDAAATACDAIGSVIGESLRGVPTVLLAGGGAGNRALASAIARHVEPGVRVGMLDEEGIAATHREAIEFAILGALCEDGVPITLPGITGVPDASVLSGAWARV